MWKNYVNAASVDEALDILFEFGSGARIIAGGTDLVLEIENNQRNNLHTLVDISRIPDLNSILLDEVGTIHIGPMVTHNDCVSSKLVREYAYPLCLAAWSVGAPQIRNRGTIAGNLITASPANDTIPPLIALDAVVTLKSKHTERRIPLNEFYTGVRETVLREDEMLVDIAFPGLGKNQRGTFAKLGLRQAQAISVVNIAVVLSLHENIIVDAKLALGSVAPRVICAENTQRFLVGKPLTNDVIRLAAEKAVLDISPIDDIRGSAQYRREMVKVYTRRALNNLSADVENAAIPKNPILLRYPETRDTWITQSVKINCEENNRIVADINGKTRVLVGFAGKTLLSLLRDGCHLTGTKDGCSEGECGACTVIMDGMAVMSCLVPAERANGSMIETVEGLSDGEKVHPLQETFVRLGAVQCGYCTPGILMSASALLVEKDHPDLEDIKQSITGNLCRCTGYYKIIKAIETIAAIEA